MTDIAFFGGSFNPPHRGHQSVAQFLGSLSFFDEVWVVPTFSHAFDKNLAPYDLRFKMCQIAFSGLSPKIKVSDIEKKSRSQPSYTLTVIRYAKTLFPHSKFWIVLGSDCRKNLKRWYGYQKLKNEVGFLFLPRVQGEEGPFPSASSSQIRDELGMGLVPNLLDPLIYRFIVEHKIDYKINPG